MKRHVFWIFYAAFVIGLLIAGFAAMNYVQEVLDQYEASQPEKVVEQQIEAIRKAAASDRLEEVITFQKVEQAEYDRDISDFREYKDKIRNAKELRYKIKNGYSDTEQTFHILADDETVAVLTLESVNEETELAILKVNEWKVKQLTPVLTLVTYNYVADVPEGFSVTINGTKLTDAEPSAEPGWETYRVNTLYQEPEIKVYDEYGTEALYDIADNHVKPIVYSYELKLPKEIEVYAGGRKREGKEEGGEMLFSFVTVHETLELEDIYGNRTEYHGGDTIFTYTYKIKVPDNFKVFLHGQNAENYCTKREANEKYQYCAEYTSMPELVTYEIKNAICEPETEIYDNLNQKVDCVFENGVFEVTEQTGLETIPEDVLSKVDVMEIAKMWSKLMTNDLPGPQKGFGTMKNYLITDSYLYNVAYKWVTSIDITFTFSHTLMDPPFTQERISNFISYGDNLFSCDIYFVKHMKDRKDRNEGGISDVMNSTFYFLYYDETEDGVDNPRWVIVDIREILSE